jgi:electron transfer flavoprotein alpha subunit
MSTLILVEHDNQTMHPSMHNTLAAALQLDTHIIMLVIGKGCENVMHEASKLHSVKEVWYLDAPHYEHVLAEQWTDLVASFSAPFDYILAPSSTFGKNVLPRIAATLDVTQVSDVTAIINSDTFEHPIYAGNAIETVRVLDKTKVLSIRATAFSAETAAQAPCPVEHIPAKEAVTHTRFIGHTLSISERPELGHAKIVVSGGRGLQSAEQFKLIEELADALGAAVGASRAAVDAGFVANDCQVGQTGKIVAPTLYIAVGISGAVQHIAGMKDSRVIVAINKDRDAPIFQIANYGLVGDLFELVPELIRKISAIHTNH